MNILHVVSGLHRGGGGTSEVIPRLCREQKKQGHNVSLVTLETSDYSIERDIAIKAGVNHLTYPRLKIIRKLGLSSAMKKALPELIVNSDIVHLHGLWQAPCWYAAAECRRQHKPYVMMPHGFLESERLKISHWKKRLIAWLFENHNLKNASALIATSESEMKGFRLYGLSNPVYIMPIGLDIEKYIIRSESSSHYCNNQDNSPHNYTLLFLSRITPIKGLDLLAEAWSQIYNSDHCKWKLLIIGPDDRGYTEKMKRLYAKKCPKDSYEFRGPVYGDEKYKVFADASAFVLPTRNENWSIAVAEAMASALPVICTKGAPWRCLGENWVDTSVEGIKNGIQRIINLPDNRRRAIGYENRKWVADNLCWNKIAENMIKFYRKLIINI